MESQDSSLCSDARRSTQQQHGLIAIDGIASLQVFDNIGGRNVLLPVQRTDVLAILVHNLKESSL
jgi:hypothetical protein